MSGPLLPGGWFDAEGRRHRDFELAVLTGREEELLAQVRHPSPPVLVTEVLARCVRRLGPLSPVPAEVIHGLSVGDRQYLMLQLRRHTFGDRVRADLLCPWPECGERVTLDFAIADVPVDSPPQPVPRHAATLSDGTKVSFRLPTGADQEALTELVAVNEAAAATVLLARCFREIGELADPSGEDVAALASGVRAELEELLRQAAPAVAQTMDAQCTGCGRMFVAPFDIQRFFLGELRTDGTLLYQEVHYLAYHYHWSESEIMQMTRDKRRTYIDVLADAIGALNDAG